MSTTQYVDVSKTLQNLKNADVSREDFEVVREFVDHCVPREEVVSETLAKIHAGQDDYQRAAHIYAQLAEQEPDRADEFREKAAEMREKADGPDEES